MNNYDINLYSLSTKYKDHEPDIIVIATPHGINLSESIGILHSRVATGSAEWNRTWSEFKVSANINDEFSIELYHHLQVCMIYLSKLCVAEGRVNLVNSILDLVPFVRTSFKRF